MISFVPIQLKNLKKQLSPEEEYKITSAINLAKQLTSCEIRVHIQLDSEGDVLDQATEIFAELNMHKSKNRNGILVFVALASRKFAIVGDAGVHEKVSPHFWDDIKEHLISYFKRGEYGEGVATAIDQMAENLSDFFPPEN
jgi:uncharacterized membrane protein YgcG